MSICTAYISVSRGRPASIPTQELYQDVAATSIAKGTSISLPTSRPYALLLFPATYLIVTTIMLSVVAIHGIAADFVCQHLGSCACLSSGISCEKDSSTGSSWCLSSESRCRVYALPCPLSPFYAHRTRHSISQLCTPLRL